MVDRVCLVTGATNGIGFETALGVARLGATTILVGRDPARGEAAVARITTDTGNARVECLIADLASQRDVKALVDQVRARYPKLNVLINNAGVITSRRMLTCDGIETQWAVNHLAYYIIAESLAETLVANAPARIINVASDAHYDGRIDFTDISGGSRYWAPRAYSQSKLANVLHAYDLSRRLTGTGVTANCLHPGVIASNFGLNNHDWLGSCIWIRNRFIRGSRDGARTSIYLASSRDVADVSGVYFAECMPKKSSPRSHDIGLQLRLREISEQMTHIAPARAATQGSVPIRE
jgi:NAD(P)-dependent dehydrogenase (short-subunit alcohol dehydrogenase family)